MSYYYLDTGNSFNQKLISHDIQTISPAQLIQHDEKFHKSVKGLVLQCELNCAEEGEIINRNSLNGLKLARDLRLRYDRRYPILFVSFLSLETIKKESVNASLIEAIGHDFLRLPASGAQIIQRLKEINPLTSTELRDVQWFSCKPDGIINSLVHQLPVVVHKLENDPGYVAQQAKKELEDCIHQIHFVIQSDPDDCLDRFRLQFSEISLKNVAEACKFVKTEGEKIILELFKNNETTEFDEDKKRPWKLLMLDDELDKSSNIIKLLQKKGVNVVYRKNAEGAMRALDRDEKHRNKIVLILCDYRLLENRNGGLFQQQTQGYTFLQQVGNRFQSRILSAMVYSGMPRKFLLETFKTFKIRTEIYSKADFGFDNLEAMNYITNRIVEIGEENYESIRALPMNNNGWEDFLHDWYIYFRNLRDYEQREQEIAEFCNKWINDHLAGLNPAPPLSKGSRITVLDKNGSKCPECGTSTNKSQSIERINENNLDYFISILKARRLAQYLFLKSRGMQTEKEALMYVHRLIKPKGFGESEPSRKQLNFTLGLKLTEFPLGATIEELSWLHFDREIFILGSYKRFRDKIEKIETISSDFISESDYISNIIRENKYKIIWHAPAEEDEGATSRRQDSIQHTLVFNKEDLSPCIFDKTDAGALIKWISACVQEHNSAEELKLFLDKYNESIKKIWK